MIPSSSSRTPSVRIGIRSAILAAFGLVATLMLMPGISGVTLAERLTELRPGLATVFISGYADFSPGAAPLPGAGRHLLEKPFTPDMVARTIRRVLDSQDSAGTKAAR